MLGRGCPYNCNYCCNNAIKDSCPNKKNYVRFPSIERGIRIIKEFIELYPHAKKIEFADDTFTLNKKWLQEFCTTYKKEIGLPFICNARVETIDEKVVVDLKTAGCTSLYFGIETGNEWLRNYILNRKHSNKQIINALNIVKKNRIKCFSSNIVGLPFETKKMMKETYKLNYDINVDNGICFYFFPFPGTKLYQICLKYGVRPRI